eukprot:6392124-Prymnesium_polylepis.3
MLIASATERLIWMCDRSSLRSGARESACSSTAHETSALHARTSMPTCEERPQAVCVKRSVSKNAARAEGESEVA